MTIREKILIAIIAGLLCGLYLDRTTEAQNPSLAFGMDSSSSASVPIQTDGSNALKVLAK